jgi:hypothetical protein
LTSTYGVEPVMDLVYLATGVVIFIIFAGYAVLLRRA